MSERNRDRLNDDIQISNIWELKQQLWLQENIPLEELTAPIKVAREELRNFRDEISSTPEWQKLWRIKIFIEEKTRITIETEQRLNDLMWDGSIAGVISNATQDIRRDFEEAAQSEWIWKIDKFFWVFDKLWGVWDRIVLGFSWLMWKFAPSLAQFFWLENPSLKIANEVLNDASNQARQAQERLREEHLGINQSIENANILTYKTYGSVYFRLFSASNELDKITWVDSNLERQISSDLLWHNEYFRDLKYSELKNPNQSEKLYNELSELNPNFYSKQDKNTVKKHIRLVLKSIVGWEESYKTWIWFKETLKQEILRGNNFLIDVYKREEKDIIQENPTVKEIFEKLTSLRDFEIFSIWSFDIEEVLKWANWSVNNFLNKWPRSIADMTPEMFQWVQSDLPEMLHNFDHFRLISTTLLRSHDSRNLENNFSFNENWNHDSISSSNNRKLIENFIWNENEWLIQFWHEMYENIFVKWVPIQWLSSVKKSDLSLKDVYRIYVATGWISDIEKLDPMKKLNLTTLLLFGFSDSQGLGQKLGELSKISSASSIQVSEDVQNLLIAIWNTSKDLVAKAAKEVGKFAWGFMTENPPLAAGIVILLWKFPFLTKRQSFSDLAFRR